MAFSIDGTTFRLPSGAWTIRQDAIVREDGGHHTTIADLTIEIEGRPAMRGKLRFTDEAFQRFPGRGDDEKSAAVARRLMGWIAESGLLDGFFLRVDADDAGVQISDSSR